MGRGVWRGRSRPIFSSQLTMFGTDRQDLSLFTCWNWLRFMRFLSHFNALEGVGNASHFSYYARTHETSSYAHVVLVKVKSTTFILYTNRD